MERDFKRKTCDWERCGKVQDYDGVPRFGGGPPFDGWIEITRIGRGYEGGRYDFCCLECATKFLEDELYNGVKK